MKLISYLTPDLYYFESSGFDSNIYVYAKKIIIDTGYSNGHASRIIKHLRKYEIVLDKIGLTHPHPDHSSNVSNFQKEFGAEVVVHEGLKNRFVEFGDKLVLVKDGDVIKLNEELSLEVIHTPGHTPFDICFYDRKNKVLFSGDCVFSHGNIGRTDLPGGSTKKLVESITKLTKLEVEWLCPGHMQAVENGNKHILTSLDFARQAATFDR